MRIVVGGGGLARYPQGGGHWSWALQYLRGLKDLGHEVLLLQFLASTGSRATDRARADAFFARLEEYWAIDSTALLVLPQISDQRPESAEVAGIRASDFWQFVRSAQLLWSLAGGVQPPLRDMFVRRVLVDVDPGHLQLGPDPNRLRQHDAFLTIGLKVHTPDCLIPTLGVKWHAFTPFVYLRDWERSDEDRADAPFSSVSHWSWGGEVELGSRVISTSKRDAYLRWLDLPRRAGRGFELATKLFREDDSGDWQTLSEHGWSIVDPWEVASTPSRYKTYIASSRAELCCPKPIWRELRTGWFSDRSVAYLASGKPVLAEATGFEDLLPCGAGLIAFRTWEEVLAGVAQIDADYRRHSLAAAEMAAQYFSSRIVLPKMLEASFV